VAGLLAETICYQLDHLSKRAFSKMHNSYQATPNFHSAAPICLSMEFIDMARPNRLPRLSASMTPGRCLRTAAADVGPAGRRWASNDVPAPEVLRGALDRFADNAYQQ